MDYIESNLLKYKEELDKFPAAKLLAVSKTKSSEFIKKAYSLGQRDFGENKVQELVLKSNELKECCPDIRWHFIGSLQSNKINGLLGVKHLVSIHSIDSIKLLNKLIQKSSDRKLGLFLQVNTSGEIEKSGFNTDDEVLEAIKQMEKLSGFYLQGLMTIGKIRTENFNEEAKICFNRVSELKQRIDSSQGLNLELSMGMSSDYKIALDYKSNWIRIGSGIFGKR